MIVVGEIISFFRADHCHTFSRQCVELSCEKCFVIYINRVPTFSRRFSRNCEIGENNRVGSAQIELSCVIFLNRRNSASKRVAAKCAIKFQLLVDFKELLKFKL